MPESDLCLTWIESTLTNDLTFQALAPGGVQQTFPLPGITPPYTVVKYMNDGVDVLQFGGRAYSDMHFSVVVSGPIASQQSIASAADRSESLLTVTTQTAITGGILISSVRSQPISEDVWVDGAKWHQSGGIYHIRAKSS